MDELKKRIKINAAEPEIAERFLCVMLGEANVGSSR